MIKIINKTLSPYDIQSKNGPVRLPAMGEIEGEFETDYVEILKASGSVEVVEVEVATENKKHKQSRK